MKKALGFFFLGLFFISSCSLSSGELSRLTYYVSAEGSDETGTGQSNAAWKSIEFALSQMSPGDTLMIGPGDYSEEMDGWLSVDLNFVTLKAVENGTAVFGYLSLSEVEGVTLDGLRFEGPHGGILPDFPSVVVDDTNVVLDFYEDWSVRESDTRQKYATYFTQYDAYYNDWSEGIVIRESEEISVQNCSVFGHTVGIYVIDNCENIRILSNHVEDCYIGIYGDLYTTGNSVVQASVASNFVSQCLSEGICFRYADQVEIFANTCEYQGLSHILLQKDSENCTIRNNTCRYGGYYSETMDYPGSSAVNIHFCAGGNVIDGNDISYQYDTTAFDGNGIILDYTPDGGTVVNNLIYYNQGSGITMTHSGNAVIANNTCAENGLNSLDVYNSAGIRFSGSDSVSNTVANNLLLSNSVCGVFSDGLLSEQRFLDYNFYSEDLAVWDGWDLVDWDKQYSNVVAIQTNTAFSAHAGEGDPLVEDASSVNLRLQSGSPLIGNASPSYAPVYDFDRKLRDSFPDCGAFEY